VALLTRYVAEARALGAEHVTVLGTEPLRRASDRSVLQADVLRATGVPLHVLSHESEAELTLLGVTAGRLPPAPLMVLDIGGGSTELIVAAPGLDPVVGALQTGSSRLGERFIHHDPPTWFELNGLRAEAARLFEAMPQAQPSRAVVAGGTGTNTNRLLGRLRLGQLDAPLLDAALSALAQRPVAEIAAATGMSERRIRQLPAGIALVEAMLRRYGLKRILTSDASLREGAIHAADRAGDAWPEQLSAMLREPTA
jgi:exopolyphosphatase/guanosine-5'-triphosphate,3'-diphosphate pyrophosphatase